MKRPTSKRPNLTLDTKRFVDNVEAQNLPPIYKLAYEEARKVLLNAQAQNTLPKELDCDIQDIEIPIRENEKVDIRIFKPKNAKVKLPIIMYYHGGGWVMGDKNTHDRLAREIAVGVEAAVAFVNYTPSPEAQYPLPIEQAYGALEYVYLHANKFNFDATKIAVMGDSVGGNMAAVMTLMSKVKRGPRIKFQVLMYPVTGAYFKTPSYKDFADGPWLTRKAMEWFWNAYCPDKKQREGIYISPLQATVEQLKNLPSALVITAENDVLRDEGEAYAQKLMAAGIDVAAVRYNGTIHDFVMLNALAKTAPAKTALRQIIENLREALKD